MWISHINQTIIHKYCLAGCSIHSNRLPVCLSCCSPIVSLNSKPCKNISLFFQVSSLPLCTFQGPLESRVLTVILFNFVVSVRLLSTLQIRLWSNNLLRRWWITTISIVRQISNVFENTRGSSRSAFYNQRLSPSGDRDVYRWLK